jgi:hypothetical protein
MFNSYFDISEGIIPDFVLQNKHPTPPAFELLNQGTIASACLS